MSSLSRYYVSLCRKKHICTNNNICYKNANRCSQIRSWIFSSLRYIVFFFLILFFFLCARVCKLVQNSVCRKIAIRKNFRSLKKAIGLLRYYDYINVMCVLRWFRLRSTAARIFTIRLTGTRMYRASIPSLFLSKKKKLLSSLNSLIYRDRIYARARTRARALLTPQTRLNKIVRATECSSLHRQLVVKKIT